MFWNRPAPIMIEFAMALFISLFLGFVFHESPTDRRSGISDRFGFLLAILVLFQIPLAYLSANRGDLF